MAINFNAMQAPIQNLIRGQEMNDVFDDFSKNISPFDWHRTMDVFRYQIQNHLNNNNSLHKNQKDNLQAALQGVMNYKPSAPKANPLSNYMMQNINTFSVAENNLVTLNSINLRSRQPISLSKSYQNININTQALSHATLSLQNKQEANRQFLSDQENDISGLQNSADRLTQNIQGLESQKSQLGMFDFSAKRELSKQIKDANKSLDGIKVHVEEKNVQLELSKDKFEKENHDCQAGLEGMKNFEVEVDALNNTSKQLAEKELEYQSLSDATGQILNDLEKLESNKKTISKDDYNKQHAELSADIAASRIDMNDLKTGMSQLKSDIKEHNTAIAGFCKEANRGLNQINQGMAGIQQPDWLQIQSGANTMKNVAQTAVSHVKNFVNKLVGHGNTLAQAATALTTSQVKKIPPALGNLSNQTKQTGSKALVNAKSQFNVIKNITKLPFQLANKAVNSVKNSVKLAAGLVAGAITSVKSSASQGLDKAMNSGKEFAQGIKDKVADTAEKVKESGKSIFGAIKGIGAKAKSMVDKAIEIGKSDIGFKITLTPPKQQSDQQSNQHTR